MLVRVSLLGVGSGSDDSLKGESLDLGLGFLLALLRSTLDGSLGFIESGSGGGTIKIVDVADLGAGDGEDRVVHAHGSETTGDKEALTDDVDIVREDLDLSGLQLSDNRRVITKDTTRSSKGGDDHHLGREVLEHSTGGRGHTNSQLVLAEHVSFLLCKQEMSTRILIRVSKLKVGRV